MPRTTSDSTPPPNNVVSLTPRPAGATVGVIDLGSNSVRLVVAEVVPGLPPRVVAEDREPVRLGEGVFQTGLLNAAAAERTLQAMRRLAAVAGARGVQKVLARGTCALREAEDREPFLQRIKETCGVEVVVLTGQEEARMIARGVLGGLPDTAGEVVVVDVGGGSVEVARAIEGTITDVASLRLGAVRLSEMFLRSDPPSTAEVDLLRAHARASARSVLTFTAGNKARILGSAGTIHALWQVARGGKGAPVVTVDEMEQVVLSLAKLPLAKRRSVPHLEPKRADIIVGGGLALLEVARHLGASSLEVTRRGLKEGLLMEAVESLGMALPSPTEPERVRVDGALALARRFEVDEGHASQVAALACSLFEGTRELHRLGDDARSELEVAALLHDVGQYISFDKHHRHSAYIIANSQIPGFSDTGKTRLACIARYHRKSGPAPHHEEWQELSKEDRKRVKYLAALLRVADALDRSHHRLVQQLKVEHTRGEVTVRMTTTANADMELWAANEKADVFEDAFGMKLRVQLDDATDARTKRGRAKA
ncbi:MAG: Ppx/GppA phosphatase family protein [Myxococcota bacterium]